MEGKTWGFASRCRSSRRRKMGARQFILVIEIIIGKWSRFSDGLITGLARKPARQSTRQGGKKMARAGHALPHFFHNHQPGPAGKQGDARRHTAQQHQGAPQIAKHRLDAGVDHVADEAARGEVVNIGEVHAAERRHRQEEDQEAENAQAQRQVVHLKQTVGTPEDAPAQKHHDQGHQVGKGAKNKERQISNPSPRTTRGIVYLAAPGRL